MIGTTAGSGRDAQIAANRQESSTARNPDWPPCPPAIVERERPRMPTAKQLAEAADIATRFAEASVRTDEEEYAALRRAAHAMGMAALARTARDEK